MEPELRSGIETLAEAGDISLSDEDWKILSQQAAEIKEAQKSRIEQISDSIFRGFIALASEGHEFVPASRIQDRFGRTLKANYPEANQLFLRFATTYWTFKLWLQDGVAGDSQIVAGGLLANLEQQAAALFFPTPGPVQIPADQRETKQREILRRFGATFDIDSFMSGNPILLRDRQRQSAGGCGSAVILLGLAMTAVAVLV